MLTRRPIRSISPGTGKWAHSGKRDPRHILSYTGSTRLRVWQPSSSVVTALVFTSTLSFRFLSLPMDQETLPLPIEHFYHLARARQLILFGELPFRDFFDPGHFLRVVASAAVQWLFGYHLLGEVLLCAGFLAFGAALTFQLAFKLTESTLLAFLVTLLSAAALPDLHDYPKVFLLPLSVFVSWRYVDRPCWSRLLELALMTTLAFYFRHDYALYVAVGSVTGLVLAPLRAGVKDIIRRGVTWAALVCAGLLPFLIFLHLNGGLAPYFRIAFGYVGAHGITPQSMPWRFHGSITWRAATIKVRWAAAVTEQRRSMLERRFHLLNGRYVDGRTWEYDLTDLSSGNVASLLRNSDVEDTDGIDRSTGRVPLHPAMPINVRMTPQEWLANLITALPLVGALASAYRLTMRKSADSARRRSASRLGVLAATAGSASPIVLRQVDGPHIAASLPLTAALAAWLLSEAGHGVDRLVGRGVRALRHQVDSTPVSMRANYLARPATEMLHLTVVLVAILTAWRHIHAIAPIDESIRRAVPGANPVAVVSRGMALASILRASPPLNALDHTGPPSRVALFRYLHSCTKPDDRLLIASSHPVYDLYFYSDRGFAGGVPNFDPFEVDWRGDEQRTLARLQSQSVPLIMADLEQQHPFATQAGLVEGYIEHHYTAFRDLPITETRTRQTTYRLFVARDRAPTGWYAALDLPCFS